jgi:hypothetical protein
MLFESNWVLFTLETKKKKKIISLEVKLNGTSTWYKNK